MTFTPPTVAATQNAIIRAEQFLNAGNAEEAIRLLAPLPEIQGPLAPARDFLLGRAYLELKRPSDALAPLSRAIQAQKSNANYRIAYGAALHLTKNLVDAEKNYREAMRLAPTAENPPFNLARVLADKGDLDGAMRAYRAAIMRNPRYGEAMAALADIMVVRADLGGAHTLIQQALGINPKNSLAWNTFGKLVERMAKYEEAASHFQKATECDTEFADAWYNLGRMRGHLKDQTRADACFARALALDPNNEQFQFMRGLLGTTPESATTAGGEHRVPDSYVKQLFDQYAETFDKNLVQDLSYQTPQALYQMLLPALPVPANTDTNADTNTNTSPILAALDLGCGTGLMGPLIAKHCATLVGVDLSPKMLEKAEGRGYTKLVAAEVNTFLASDSRNSLDLIVAADVFVYIGDLAKIFTESARIMRANGLFAFSVEALEDTPDFDPTQPFKLLPSGRYAQNSAYIQQLAQQNGFKLISAAKSQIRMEASKPIQGALFVFQKSAV